jgi:hypothetical protein
MTIETMKTVVQVRSTVLEGVAPSEALRTRLRELSDRLPGADLLWIDGAVVVTTEVPVEMAEEDEILEAGITVQRVAAHFEADLHDRFGGQRLALAA